MYFMVGETRKGTEGEKGQIRITALKLSGKRTAMEIVPGET